MTKKARFYWHVHHNILFEWCYDEQERRDFIKNNKPANEVETRLKWMTPVKGKLPGAIIKALEACDKAWEAYDKAWEAYHKGLEAYDKAWELWKAYYKAREACDKAWLDHKNELKALHAKEHPDCPWDGKTLFPKDLE